MADKIVFSTTAQTIARDLANHKATMADLVKAYFDRGYSAGGSNPIVDADVASLNIKAADVASFITLAQQSANFFGNSTVATGDYAATLSKMRTDL